MNYKKIHDRIILRARKRDLSGGYYERHHVIPLCLKENNNTDIVKLYPEEHFLIHKLLVKICPGNPDLIFALHRMATSKNGQSYNNKFYGWVRRECIKNNVWIGRKHTQESKIKMSLAAEGRKLSDETKRRMSIFQKGRKKSIEECKNISARQYGENNPSPKTLSIEIVKLIKKDCVWTLFSNVDLAKKYKVSCETIRQIRLGNRWSHITI